jgi:NAD+ kinase
MAHAFRQVAIFGKPRVDGSRPTLQSTVLEIARIVEGAGLSVMFDTATLEAVGLKTLRGYSLPEIGAAADVAVVLGGDGTMLGIARELAPYRVPLIGINHGRLGFITDIAVGQMPEVLAATRAIGARSSRLKCAVPAPSCTAHGPSTMSWFRAARLVAWSSSRCASTA